MGVYINGTDDIIIISESLEVMEAILRELAEASEKSGLKMSKQKTKIMTSRLVPQKIITVNSYIIEEVVENSVPS